MTPRRSRGPVLRAFLCCFAVVVVATIVYGGLTSATVFGAYNDNWEGTSDLRTLATGSAEEARTVQTTREYVRTDIGSTIGFILSPDSGYTDRESARVEQFVRNGGTLVVAEDYGNESDRLLSQIGADARFAGEPVRDERYYGNTPAMPRVRTASDREYTTGVETLTLNHGTVVRPNGTSVLVNTSSFAYLDRNRNERLDSDESLETYPVVTRERLGEGDVVVVGDPSLFINAMLDYADNRRFARNLVAGHRVVVFDVSHVGGIPPLIAGRSLLRDSLVVQVIAGVALIVATSYLGTAVRLPARIRRFSETDSVSPNVDADALETWIRDRHPEWDIARARQVAEEICRQRQNGSGDD